MKERLGPHRKAHEYKVSHEAWILSYKQRSNMIKMWFQDMTKTTVCRMEGRWRATGEQTAPQSSAGWRKGAWGPGADAWSNLPLALTHSDLGNLLNFVPQLPLL